MFRFGFCSELKYERSKSKYELFTPRRLSCHRGSFCREAALQYGFLMLQFPDVYVWGRLMYLYAWPMTSGSGCAGP